MYHGGVTVKTLLFLLPSILFRVALSPFNHRHHQHPLIIPLDIPCDSASSRLSCDFTNMPPRLHLVRHAQGFHNLNVANHAMHDPLLTPVGLQQCKDLSESFPYMADVDLVVASPLKRTVYTALYSFPKPIESKHLKVIVLPELQETSDLPCDTGSDVAEVEREFAGKPVDLATLHTPQGATWNNNKGKYAPQADAIQGRAREARQWLMNRPEKDIVVVTHGGFLHYFTEDWSGADKFNGTISTPPVATHVQSKAVHRRSLLHMFHTSQYPSGTQFPRQKTRSQKRTGTGWANTEFRSYTFDIGGDATLVETQESLKRREGTEKPLSKEEQNNLHRTTTQRWQKDGLIRAKEIHAKV